MKTKKAKKIRYSTGDKVFLGIDGVILTAVLVAILYPLLFVISASFNAAPTVMSLSLIPDRFTLAAYKAVFEYRDIWISYGNSLFYMCAGTLISLCVTVMCAYPLSRGDLKGAGVFMALCMVTMYFSGGLIPTFLQVRALGLHNSRWAVLLPGAMSVYNMIVMRTYFRTQVPLEVLESSQLDGCGNIQYLFSILLPLSGPILAVIGLFYAVSYWNAYFDAMIYLADRDKFPLSLILREILILNRADADTIDVSEMIKLEERRNLMKYAVIVIGSLPVMLLYPFVQKYFVKGMMIGAVKG